MPELVTQSRTLKTTADTILAESCLLETLAAYGEVKVVGSYALDVMLRPDIDVYVVAAEHHWENIRSLMNALMDQRYFSEIGFLNWIDFPTENHVDIKGYYFQPCRWVENVFWKIDLWLITPEFDKDTELTQKFAGLLSESPEKRDLILEIKNAFRKGNGYETGISGQRIYEAVLEKGVTSFEDFKKLLV